jgi:hypothetical protein
LLAPAFYLDFGYLAFAINSFRWEVLIAFAINSFPLEVLKSP